MTLPATDRAAGAWHGGGRDAPALPSSKFELRADAERQKDSKQYVAHVDPAKKANYRSINFSWSA
jgi:hypothetical protein